MKLEGIIFDQDGVLFDSEPIHFLAIQNYMNDLGYEYTKDSTRFTTVAKRK